MKEHDALERRELAKDIATLESEGARALNEDVELLRAALLRCLREIQPHHIPSDVYMQAQLAIGLTEPQKNAGLCSCVADCTDPDRQATLNCKVALGSIKPRRVKGKS